MNVFSHVALAKLYTVLFHCLIVTEVKVYTAHTYSSSLPVKDLNSI